MYFVSAVGSMELNETEPQDCAVRGSVPKAAMKSAVRQLSRTREYDEGNCAYDRTVPHTSM